jgi:MFS transporter, DHA2 family, multidrug resistance protein
MSIGAVVVSFLRLRGTPDSRVESKERRRFDWYGFTAFIIAMVALNIVIGQGAAPGWLNPAVMTLAVVFVIAAMVFFRAESGSADGFVDLTLFKNKTYAGATLSSFLLTGAAGTLLGVLALV